MNTGQIILVAGGSALLLGLTWFIVNFNRFVRVRQHIRESWSDVDVELKRRHDLIPNLVETVRGYAAHERQALDAVVAARNKAAAGLAAAEERGALRATGAALAADESALSRGVRRMLAVAEAYPQLKADANFLALQRELAATEDRIAASRRFFNGNVRELNQLCGAFPTNMIAAALGIRPAEFFELESAAEREHPGVAGLSEGLARARG